MLRQYPITAFIIVGLHEIKGESLSFLITKFGHAPHESDPLRRGLLKGRDGANAQHFLGRLLRTHHKRPCSRRAAEQACELASPHSITSSARASSVGGTSRPSVLAVFRLTTSSKLVGCCTVRLPGLSPLRMRPA